ncbi:MULTISPECIES: hypothetical protein [Streptomyces]|uniref:hypothetical protein n=1 Tax=Streptomyces TaxID=1883 RepID=UPI0012FECCE0|nr:MULTISPECIES: hypothetical protein [Streptomyces]
MRVSTALLAQTDAEGNLDWVVAIDSTTVPRAPARRWSPPKGPRPASRVTMPSDDVIWLHT